MKPHIAAFAALTLLIAPAAFAETMVEHVWVRATSGLGRVTAGYGVIANTGAKADKLLSVTTPDAKMAEIHESKNQMARGGVISMEPVNAVPIPAGGKLDMKPGGFHVMIMQLSRPLKAGETLPLVFKFEKQGAVKVEAKVAPLGAAGYPAN